MTKAEKLKKFKDVQNRWLTLCLFYEANAYKPEFAVFTLDDEDKTLASGKKLISIRKKYIECRDPTEYKFANEVLGGWSHWKAVQECKAIQSNIEEWREELEVLLRSEAFEKVVDKAEEGSYQAMTTILNRGWDVKKTGAPSKADKERAVKRDSSFQRRIREDAERLGIKVVE